MRYIDARSLIRTGDILLCSGTEPYSLIIRWWTRSAISHVGIAIWVKFDGECTDRLCILEAHVVKGIRLSPLSESLKHDYWNKGGKVYWARVKDEDVNREKIAAYALQQWSKPYATWYQFMIIALITIRKCRAWLRRQLDTDPDRYHCSELVAMSLQTGGCRLMKDPAMTTPDDISKAPCLHEPIELESCAVFNAGSSGNPRVREEIV